MPPDNILTEEEAAVRASAASYRDYLAEREEVMCHKWILSEKAGTDVGFEAALLDWVATARPAWRRARTKKSES